jgi:hypothetical protein
MPVSPGTSPPGSSTAPRSARKAAQLSRPSLRPGLRLVRSRWSRSSLRRRCRRRCSRANRARERSAGSPSERGRGSPRGPSASAPRRCRTGGTGRTGGTIRRTVRVHSGRSSTWREERNGTSGGAARSMWKHEGRYSSHRAAWRSRAPRGRARQAEEYRADLSASLFSLRLCDT